MVALGGGHGLAASLSALRSHAGRLTAVVTVADDGGSSGRLRRQFGVLPPGDLRMALAALCGDDDWGRTWADPCPTNGSGDFTALAGTDGFVELPPGPNTYLKGFVTLLYRW